MVQYGLLACFTNLSHLSCRMICFASLSPIWKVVPLLSTWRTPPQNLLAPVLLMVPYYWLHYFPFTVLTCRILHTLTSPYKQTLPFCLSPSVLMLLLADSHDGTTLLKYFSTWKLWLDTHKTETILFSKSRAATPPPPFPDRTPLCPLPRQCAI
jgi:hypothetical protein